MIYGKLIHRNVIGVHPFDKDFDDPRWPPRDMYGEDTYTYGKILGFVSLGVVGTKRSDAPVVIFCTTDGRMREYDLDKIIVIDVKDYILGIQKEKDND